MHFQLNVIAAACNNMGIGFGGTLPWHLPNEFKYYQSQVDKRRDEFKHIFDRNAVIAGRITWEKGSNLLDPVDTRWNIVVSNSLSQAEYPDPDKVLIVSSFEEAIESVKLNGKIDTVWVIGGRHLYEEALNSGICQNIYLTRIYADFECDTFFPEIPTTFQVCSQSEMVEEKGLKYQFFVFKNTNYQTDWWHWKIWLLSSDVSRHTVDSKCFASSSKDWRMLKAAKSSFLQTSGKRLSFRW